MVSIGWDTFCKRCGVVIKRGRELCQDCASFKVGSRCKIGGWVLIALILTAAVSACLTRPQAENAVDSYLQSYYTDGGILAPTDAGRELLINNLMCVNQQSSTAPPPPVGAYEVIISQNASHLITEVHDFDMAGKPFTYTKTRELTYTPPDEPSNTTVIQPTSLSLEERIAALEAKLTRLCNSGIKEAC